jgi:NAD(P)-dependent dehydrogenase (short-subunit alcohol dehydrogenase family)
MNKILITGGSRGIGRATVKHFLTNNWEVVTTSTSGNLDYSEPNLTVYKMNLENTESISKLVQALKTANHTYDCVINNAWKTIRNLESNDFINLDYLSQMLEVNLVGTINLTQQILPLVKVNGVIVNISSEYGSLTEDWGFEVPSYRIAKAGLNMFARNFYKNPKVISKNIKVYSFDPGWVKTDMGGPTAPRNPEEPAKELFDLVNSKLPTGEFYRGLEKRDW